MSANTNPIFPATIRSNVAIIGEDDFGYPNPLFRAGANGTRIDAIVGANLSSVPVPYWIYYLPPDSGNNMIPIGYGEIAVGAGITAPLHDMMPAQLLDADGKFYMAAANRFSESAAGVLMVKLFVPLGSPAPGAPFAADENVTILVQAGDY